MTDSRETYQRLDVCRERHKGMDKEIKGINQKFWAIVLMIIAQAIFVAVRGL